MKERGIFALTILILFLSLSFIQATTYYCQWSWPQKITNKDTSAVLYTCPSATPYCKAGTTQCCKYDSVTKIYSGCIESGIASTPPSSSTTTPPTTTTTPSTPTPSTTTPSTSTPSASPSISPSASPSVQATANASIGSAGTATIAPSTATPSTTHANESPHDNETTTTPAESKSPATSRNQEGEMSGEALGEKKAEIALMTGINKDSITKIKIDGANYKVTVKEPKLLFGLIPVDMSVEKSISQGGAILSEKKPWWSLFAPDKEGSKDNNGGEEEKEAEPADSYYCCGADTGNLGVSGNCSKVKFNWTTWSNSGVVGPACWKTRCEDYCKGKGFGYWELTKENKKCQCLKETTRDIFYCCGQSTQNVAVTPICNYNKYEWKTWAGTGVTGPACYKTKCDDYCMSYGFKRGLGNNTECKCINESKSGMYYCCGPDTNHVSVGDSCAQTKFDWKTWDNSDVVGPACWKTKCNDLCMNNGFKTGTISADSKQCQCSTTAVNGTYYCCGTSLGSATVRDNCNQTKFSWRDSTGASSHIFCGPTSTKDCDSYCFVKGFNYTVLNSDKTQCKCTKNFLEGNKGMVSYCCNNQSWSISPCASNPESKCSADGNCKDLCALRGMDSKFAGTGSGEIEDRYRCECKAVEQKKDTFYCCGKDTQHMHYNSNCFYNKYEWKTWDTSGVDGPACWKTTCESLCFANGNSAGTVSGNKQECVCSGTLDLEGFYNNPKYYCCSDKKWSQTPCSSYEESYCASTDGACATKCGLLYGELGRMNGSSGTGDNRYRCECYGRLLDPIQLKTPLKFIDYQCCANHDTNPGQYTWARVWWPINMSCPSGLKRVSTSFCDSYVGTGKCSNLCSNGAIANNLCHCPENIIIPWSINTAGEARTIYDLKSGKASVGTLKRTVVWAYAKAKVNLWNSFLSDHQKSDVRAFDYQTIEVHGPRTQIKKVNISMTVRYSGVIDDADTGMNPKIGTGIIGTYLVNVNAGIARDAWGWETGSKLAEFYLWGSEYSPGQWFKDVLINAGIDAVVGLLTPTTSANAINQKLFEKGVEGAKMISDAGHKASNCLDYVDRTEQINFTNVPFQGGSKYNVYISLEAHVLEAAIGTLGVGFTEVDFMNTKPDACDNHGKDIPERGISVEKVVVQG